VERTKVIRRRIVSESFDFQPNGALVELFDDDENRNLNESTFRGNVRTEF